MFTSVRVGVIVIQESDLETFKGKYDDYTKAKIRLYFCCHFVTMNCCSFHLVLFCQLLNLFWFEVIQILEYWKTMGQSLTRAAEWTSAASSGRGKLAFSPVNEQILKEIIGFTEAIPSRHPDCADLVFQKALIYDSSLSASSFGGSGLVITPFVHLLKYFSECYELNSITRVD